MRLGIILSLLFLLSCSSKGPSRQIASEVVHSCEEVSLENSTVKVFPVGKKGHYFYIELRDNYDGYADCDSSEFSLRSGKNKNVSFKFERLHSGRYYLTLTKMAEISSGKVDLYLQNRLLKKQVRLTRRYPNQSKSSIHIVEANLHSITFRLRLADKSNRPVELPNLPEIHLEGRGTIEGLIDIGNGEWEFSLIYPDENQILYFSVRTLGVFLPKLFRYQYIEK